jgi:hypothetical protein
VSRLERGFRRLFIVAWVSGLLAIAFVMDSAQPSAFRPLARVHPAKAVEPWLDSQARDCSTLEELGDKIFNSQCKGTARPPRYVDPALWKDAHARWESEAFRAASSASYWHSVAKVLLVGVLWSCMVWALRWVVLGFVGTP